MYPTSEPSQERPTRRAAIQEHPRTGGELTISIYSGTSPPSEGPEVGRPRHQDWLGNSIAKRGELPYTPGLARKPHREAGGLPFTPGLVRNPPTMARWVRLARTFHTLRSEAA